MYKEINIEMGTRIRATRKQVGLTSERLAELLGISNQFLCDVERGKKSLSYTNMKKLCNTLSVSADYIIMGGESSDKKARAHDIIESIDEAYLPMIEVAMSNALQIILMAREQKKELPPRVKPED